MKPQFLNTPKAWTRAARSGQSRIDYACPLQIKRAERSDRWLLVLFVVVCGAMLLGAI